MKERADTEKAQPLLVRPRRTLTASGFADECSLLLRSGRVAAIGAEAERDAGPATVLEAADLTAVPGFLDLQCNGAFGSGLAERPEELWTWTRGLVRFGVTALLPTVISSPPRVVERALATLRSGPPDGWDGPRLLGLHLEGPFLAPGRAGAHERAHLRGCDARLAASWSPADGVAMVTLAPELPGALEMVRELSARGVLVALGHSEADLDCARAAFAAGARYVTHLFNAMSPMHHREPGLVGAALTTDEVAVGLIADGLHVRPELWEMVRRSKPAGAVSLVTDAMAGLGLPFGARQLGGRTAMVGADGARLADGTLAGSVLALDQALRNWIAGTGADLEEALATVTSTPAALLGSDLGRIAKGAPADLVLLDEAIEPRLTLVGGVVVHDAR